MFRFRRTFRLGPLRFTIGKRGLASIGIGRVSKARGRGLRVRVPTGISGLWLSLGGKRKKR